MDTTKITRIEVIDHTPAKPDDDFRGRVYVKWEDNLKVELSVQDDGRTLKIFLN